MTLLKRVAFSPRCWGALPPAPKKSARGVSGRLDDDCENALSQDCNTQLCRRTAAQAWPGVTMSTPRSLRLCQQSIRAHPFDRFMAVLRIHLFHDAPEMIFNSKFGQIEMRRDLLIGKTFGDQLQ
jgi:hypothetical protein